MLETSFAPILPWKGIRVITPRHSGCCDLPGRPGLGPGRSQVDSRLGVSDRAAAVAIGTTGLDPSLRRQTPSRTPGPGPAGQPESRSYDNVYDNYDVYSGHGG